jgi:hypothetical protein
MLLKISKQFTKHTVQKLSFSARERIQPTAYLPTSTWPLGPATDQQAAEPACSPLPHGPKLARERPAAAGRPSRWTAERTYRRDKTRSGAGCPVTLSPFFSSPASLAAHSGGGGFHLPRDR